jgi:hypothetical protein
MKTKITTLKKVDNNTIVEEKSHIVRWFDYQCLITGSLKPMNEVGIERLAYEVRKWALEDPKALRLSQFFHKMGISGITWRRWCIKFPVLQQASDEAREIIGERREIGALNNELNTQVVAFTMPFYDQEWKDETVRRASLKEGSNEAKATVLVTMNPIPNSPLVPERKKDE